MVPWPQKQWGNIRQKIVFSLSEKTKNDIPFVIHIYDKYNTKRIS